MRHRNWLERLAGSSRATTASAHRMAAQFSIRQLERRRALDAAAAIVISPSNVGEGDTVTVSAETSGIDSPQFDWSVVVDSVVIETSNDALFEFTPPDNGTYAVDLVVTDSSEQQFTANTDVVVANVRPRLDIVGNQQIGEGSLLAIENLGTIRDAGFDNPLTGTQETFLYNIDWGDGFVDNASATVDQVGTPGVDTLGSFDGTHTYADNGVYTVTVTVLDDDGGTDTATFQVTVLNTEPMVMTVGNQTTTEGVELELSNLATISDPGYVNPAIPSAETFTYSIDWGDGSNADTGTATIDQVGRGGRPTLASIDGSHTYADDGAYTVTVTVLDDDDGSGSAQFDVLVENVAPSLTVAGNQTVEEGALLEVIDIGAVSDPAFAPTAGDQITYSIDWGDGTLPDNGVATIDQLGAEGQPTLASFDGAHIYADNGTYQVIIDIDDGDGGTDSGSFNVTVNNVPPTLTVAEDQMVAEGTELAIENIGQISDPAFASVPLGNTKEFAYSIDWGDGTIADTGFATIDLLGSEGQPTLASFDGAHTYADDGDYTVTIRIADDDGGEAMSTFQVTVDNVLPMLTVADDQVVTEGAELSIENIGEISDPAFASVPLGNTKKFEYSIDWGDGTIADTGFAAIDLLGSEGQPTLASFDGAHTYADNGDYTVTIRIADDDGGEAIGTFQVTVSNVAPELTGIESLTLDEGQIFTLSVLGVGLSDPGFDNPLNTADPNNGGEVEETFTATTIDWGDGSSTTPVNIFGRVSGSIGAATTAQFDHAAHAYADNGEYTVRVDFADDDGGNVSQTFVITVNNVAPTLTLISEQFTINEGDTLEIPLLGSFSDPGYDNPAHPDGPTTETFTYEITWGDGTETEIGVLPESVTTGKQGTPTVGTLTDSHFYADNDSDNRYTITVKLIDDDGDYDQQSFDITVLNVAPTLLPISAIDVTAEGNTVLTLSFVDPGADEFDVLVAWGENQDVALEDRWVLEAEYDGTTPVTFVLSHNYDGPPNPDNITADIPISVVIRDDDFSNPATIAVGQSNIETVLIGQPGTEDAKFAIDTTPEIPIIEFPRLEEVVVQSEMVTNFVDQSNTIAFDSASTELSASTERFFRLHVVMPDGRMLEGIRLPDDALDNLPALFARLPDNHYRIYQVRGDSNSTRLVLDIVVRNHRPTDPTESSEGSRDRPTTDDSPTQDVSDEGEAGPQASIVHPIGPASPSRTTAGGAMALTATALLLNPKTDWAVRLDRAFARADRRRWQSLRRRRPR